MVRQNHAFTTDASTFEAVKSNAYSILASLGPHMEPAQLGQLFQRLQVRGGAYSALPSWAPAPLLAAAASALHAEQRKPCGYCRCITVCLVT